VFELLLSGNTNTFSIWTQIAIVVIHEYHI